MLEEFRAAVAEIAGTVEEFLAVEAANAVEPVPAVGIGVGTVGRASVAGAGRLVEEGRWAGTCIQQAG